MVRQLLINSVWLAFAAVLGRMGMVLASVLVVRWIGQEAYGLVALTQATALMCGGFVGVGFGMAATKVVAETRSQAPERAGAAILLFGVGTLIVSLLAGVAVVVFRCELADVVFAERDLATLLLPGAWLLVATAVNFYQTGVLAGFEAFRGTAAANAWSSIITLPIVVVGVWQWETMGALVGQAAAMTVACGLFHVWIRAACIQHSICWSWRQMLAERAMMWRVGMPVVLLNSINAPSDWFCLAVLARQAGGIGEVAVFGIGNQWCMLLRFLPLTVGAALLPAVTRLSQTSGAATLRLVKLALVGNGLFAVAVAATFAAASPWILQCYGEEFVSHWAVLLLLLAAGTAISVQTAAERVLTGLNRVWTGFGLNAARAALYCGCAIVLVNHGALGLAQARSVTCLLHAIATVAITLAVARRVAVLPGRIEQSPGEGGDQLGPTFRPRSRANRLASPQAVAGPNWSPSTQHPQSTRGAA